MKIPLSWLEELFSTELDKEKIAQLLTELGIEVESLESYERDTLLHLSLTPNLIHAASILGVARELSHALQIPFQFPDCRVETEMGPSEIQVHVEVPTLAPRYLGRVITGVQVRPSPEWLQKKLESLGVRSVNNVVDVTNFVLFELGHPLHAFDLKKLTGTSLHVRLAKSGESITTLDGNEYFLTDETMVIADSKRPQAIAGVMGGKDSEVSAETSSIFLEAAYFDPTSIRRTARRMNIHTESSHRFERGVDPNMVQLALDRATKLITRVTGGVAHAVIEKTAQSFPPKKISLRIKRLNSILGTHFSHTEVETILKPSTRNQEGLDVLIPTYRIDLNSEIDLIEEVARLYGYNNLHDKTYAPRYANSRLHHSRDYLLAKKARTACLEEGLREILTCNLISPAELELVASEALKSRTVVKLLNPRSLQQSVLRPSLLPGCLQVVRHNLRHGTSTIAGFEIGNVHFKMKETYVEPLVGAIVLSGMRRPHNWDEKEGPFDFYDLKGILERFFRKLEAHRVRFSASHYPNLHPTKQAVMRIDDVEVGVLGEVHPLTARKADIAQPVFFAEFNLEDIKEADPLKMKPLPLYPGSFRDWTVAVKGKVLCNEIEEAVQDAKSALLENVSLLDVYQNEGVGSEAKKLTFRFFYRDQKRSLELKEVDAEHQRIVDHVRAKLGNKIEG